MFSADTVFPSVSPCPIYCNRNGVVSAQSAGVATLETMGHYEMVETFEKFILRERKRLAKARTIALARQKAAENELATVEKELSAIEAYVTAKRGRAGRRRKAGSRAPRGSRQQSLLALIAKRGALGRGEIIEALGAKGDKSAEQSISNALHALKKAKKVAMKDGKYHAA